MSTLTDPTPTPPTPGERASSFSLDIDRHTVPSAVRDYIGRIRTGNPGALPSVLGLVVLIAVFSQVSGRFLSLNNIGNIPGQGAYIAVIGMGLVFVLLLGEIDLSAATTGGMVAGFAATALFHGDLRHHVPGFLFYGIFVAMAVAIALAWWMRAWTGLVVVALGIIMLAFNLNQHPIFAILSSVCVGAAVGIFTGFLVAKVGIPSFIVTLALFLAWQGVLQFDLKSQPLSTQRYPLWNGLTNDSMSVAWSWVFIVVMIGGYGLYAIIRSERARRSDLAHEALSLVLTRVAILAAVGVVVGILISENRNTNPYKVIDGLPWAAAIVVVLMVVSSLALSKTSWGRHLYATGGNQEAARRAGIDVVHIKVTAFTLCSAFGAFGGILSASSSFSIAPGSGSGNDLLFSVAAAVIGGASLFGGRGKPANAVIGALVIVIIPNGLSLKTNLGVEYQQVITGAVLLAAAAVDALSRKQAARR